VNSQDDFKSFIDKNSISKDEVIANLKANNRSLALFFIEISLFLIVLAIPEEYLPQVNNRVLFIVLFLILFSLVIFQLQLLKNSKKINLMIELVTSENYQEKK
jgi:hypothetical protein